MILLFIFVFAVHNALRFKYSHKLIFSLLLVKKFGLNHCINLKKFGTNYIWILMPNFVYFLNLVLLLNSLSHAKKRL